ncbi:hypothetical protein [Bacillus sp. FJAT-26390]|uniref:hypothetical protein n=1 Tax=Bacillus sp. FJAT-26390 TaxID=1743142 RepID=UPI000807C230|nr:hypothetical protein [Bacillus sp. FJAT-26390]OBZ13729.1 hypothetical protein A7975_13040 [Bacillus sp. FJAT-26390]
MNASNKRLLGHWIRWMLILLSSCIVFIAMFSQSSIHLEKVVRNAMNVAEVPSAPIAIRTKIGQSYELLNIVDRKNAIYHQLFVNRTLGLLWNYRGGSFGMKLEPQVLLSFQGGMSTFGKHRHYYYVGQFNDPKISRLHVVWWDGYEQDAAISDGVYQAARSIRISEESQQNFSAMNKLFAYDANDRLLYELSDENREIRSDTVTEEAS